MRGVGLAWDNGGGRYHGRVYAAWTQQRPQDSNNLNVMFQHSDNSGRTWTKAVPLNDSQTVNSQFFPASYSTDGGARFAPGFRVSQGTSNAKDTHSFFSPSELVMRRPAWQSGLRACPSDSRLCVA